MQKPGAYCPAACNALRIFSDGPTAANCAGIFKREAMGDKKVKKREPKKFKAISFVSY